LEREKQSIAGAKVMGGWKGKTKPQKVVLSKYKNVLKELKARMSIEKYTKLSNLPAEALQKVEGLI
jgi:hypothetical protein